MEVLKITTALPGTVATYELDDGKEKVAVPVFCWAVVRRRIKPGGEETTVVGMCHDTYDLELKPADDISICKNDGAEFIEYLVKPEQSG